MNDIIVTGGTGFVGSNLVRFLKNDPTICILSRKYKSSNNDISHADYSTFFQSRSSFIHMIHLAGKAHDLKKTAEESEYFEINTDLTKRLYNRFLEEKKTKSFTYISSVKAVADQVRGFLTEEHFPDPVTAYGHSKLQAEQYIKDNLPADKTVVILRPCMIHGPGNKGNLNLLYNIIKKGIPWPLGAYDNSRSFLSIDNLCYVIQEILYGNVPTGIYNVADDDALSTAELVSIISEVCQKRSRIWNIPKSVIGIVAKAGNVLPLPLNEERLEKLTENYLVSNEKIKNALVIDNMPISAKEGMLKTLKYFESV